MLRYLLSMIKNEYKIKEKVWLSPGMSGWYFVSISKKDSKEIEKRFDFLKRGWGSLKVSVTIGTTKWKTSIFPDKKSETFLLPIKSEVRKKEKIKNNDIVTLLIEILL